MTVLFWGLVAALLAYEIIAVVTPRRGDTISERVWAAAAKRPIVPFAFGVVMGHFFW